ncbi:unnamed protein product [Rhizophagus irregularis]|nr:unnamed protein product [Rhizophagus irregularis]
MENQGSVNPTSTIDYDLLVYDDDGGGGGGEKVDDSDSLLPSDDFEFDDDLFEEACEKCSEVISKVPLLRLNASVSKPVVLLSCRHKVHFECIGNKSKLCPKCPSIDDLEKEGYYISPTFDGASKKRKRKDDSRKSTRGTKAQTAQLEKYQLVPLPKVLTWEKFRINSINYIMRLMMWKKRRSD